MIGYRMRIAFQAVFLAALLTSQAVAQPVHLPPSTTLVQDGVRYAAFDLGGFRELLRIDVRLQQLMVENELLQRQVTSAQNAATALQRALESSLLEQEVWESERVRLTALWRSENRQRLELENTPKVGSVFAWTIAAIFAAATLGLAVALAVRK